MTIFSTWHVEPECIVETFRRARGVRDSVTVRNAALIAALATLDARTYCTLGSRNASGVVHAGSFRVLERRGLAVRAISHYVAITEKGRAALARCQTAVRVSAAMEVQHQH